MGAPYQDGRMFLIDDRELIPLEADVLAVGRSASRKVFAIAKRSGIELVKGWDGEVISSLAWPTGREGIPTGYEVEVDPRPPAVTQLVPFDSGDRALLVCSEGVYVLDEKQAHRLLPTGEDYVEHFGYLQDEAPDEPLSHDMSMEHAALSPDNRLIACGHQSDRHRVFDADTYECVAEIGHMSEYPHYAQFSRSGDMLALNSCHFYNGITLGVATSLVRGLDTASYEQDKRFIELEGGARVYAAVSRGDEFIVGDASGYLRAFDTKGNFRWQMFIGSSVGDIDLDATGKRLVVSTYAGFVSMVDLDTGERPIFQIGTADHAERRRFLIWKNERKPIIW